jgi:hypothetical protein
MKRSKAPMELTDIARNSIILSKFVFREKVLDLSIFIWIVCL